MPGMTSREKNDKPASAVLSLWAWFLLAAITMVLHILAVIFVLPLSLLLDHGTRARIHGVSRFWARMLLLMTPFWRLRIEGRENLDPSKTYMIVANHQSVLDILVVLAGIQTHFKFMAKKELFGIPFLGWHLTLSGYIPIDRGRKESAREAVDRARRMLRQKVSVLLFPEGTRSPDGEVQAFKTGAFKIALEEGVDILPVTIDGTGQGIPKKSFRMRTGVPLCLRIGKPFRIDAAAPSAVEKAKDTAREAILHDLHRLRSVSSGAR